MAANSGKPTLTTERRMAIAFVTIGAIILIVAGISWSGNNKLAGHIQSLGQKTYPSTIALWQIKDGQTDIQSAERSLLNPLLDSAERQQELDRISATWAKIDGGFNAYNRLSHNNLESNLYQDFVGKWTEWRDAHRRFMNLNQDLAKAANNGQTEAPGQREAAEIFYAMHQQTYETKRPAFAAAAEALDHLLAYDGGQAALADQVAQRDVRNVRYWLTAILAVGPLTSIIFAVYFSRTIAKPLGERLTQVMAIADLVAAGDLSSKIDVSQDDAKDQAGLLLLTFRKMSIKLNNLIRKVQSSSLQVASSINEISASGRQLEATMTEQAASTRVVLGTAQDIAQTSTLLLGTMQDVQQMSQATAIAAGGSQKELARMEGTMRNLASSTQSIAAKLQVISNKANNINSIITTITKVSDQTNLLSLNAAIEAEKAGEYGRGFAVVSREIRRLADQTAVATLDIERMVKEMQSSVITGVMEMDKFTKDVETGVTDLQRVSSQMSETIKQVKGLSPSFAKVNQGMESQADGAQQISEAMLQLNEATGQTADALREINVVLLNLDNASQGLRQEVSRFKVSGTETNGNRSNSEPTAAEKRALSKA
jgi:methyl-accepting chemotaxis protein WspA